MMSLSSSSSSSVPPAFSNGWAEAANDDDRSSLLSSSSTLLPPPPPPPPPIIGRTSTSSSSSYIPPRTSSSPPTSSSPLDSLLQGLTYAFFLTALLGSAAFLGFASYREANAVPVVESAAKNGTTTFTAATMPFNNDTLSKLNYNMIVVSGKPTAVDPVTFSYSLSFSFTPCGDYADFALGQIGGNFPLKKDVALTIDSTTIKFKKGAIMPAKEMTFVFGNGLINDYPFDVYESNPIVMDATIKDEDGKSKKIPLDVLVSARFHSWKINVFQVEDMSGIGSPTQTYNGNTVQINLNMRRSTVTLVFTLIQMFNMWALSILALTLSAFTWIRNRKVEPPVLTFLCSLLFAIPKVRDAMPGVPTAGCWSDVISFFWAMILTAIAACLALVNYTVHYNFPPPEKRKPFKFPWQYSWRLEQQWVDTVAGWFRPKRSNTRTGGFGGGNV